MTKHFRKVTRRLTPFAANGKLNHRIVIETGVLLTKISLFLLGTFTLSAGTVSGTAIGENPAALLQTIKIQATAKAGDYPGGVLKNVVPRGVLRRMMFDYGKTSPDLNLGATGITGAAATSTLKTQLDLNFSHPRLANPVLTSLRLDRYKQVMMEVTMGSRDTLFTGNDRTADYTGLYMEVVEFREYAGTNGDYQPPVVLYEEDRNIPINQANTKLSVDNELQSSEAYIDVLWWFETTNNALSDAILNEMFVRQGNEEWFQSKQDHLKGEQRRYLTDAADSMTGLVYTNFAYDLGNDLTEIKGAVSELGATLDVSKPGTDAFWIGSRRIAPVPARLVRGDGG